ncbi:MAG: NAD(P)H-dependent oxidoreductase [Candidatus Polarisedimenticolaceae bacterium]|nr:NAD(P)H-dependent oxidoreductase [Candidatus Polarisedimenticolaceae bacterium]
MSNKNSRIKRILILYAHPSPRSLSVNRQLLGAVRDLPGVLINDLYESYPDFHIPPKPEQETLRRADLIVMQHPLYWYSSPGLLKHWQDVVLQEGFAFGKGGAALHGKKLMTVVTIGHSAESYQTEGYDRYPIEDFLRPFEQTAFHCGMTYLKPLAIYAAERLSDEQVAEQAAIYRQRLQAFLQGKCDE